MTSPVCVLFQLLEVTNQATDEVTGLHEKVERLKTTEQANLSAQQRFLNAYVRSLATS